MPLSFSGFSIVTPVALWSLLALGIPLLIHLFNRSRGKLVRIGNIDLIRKARKLHVTELRLTQWILLILRMAILLLAALILAGLVRPGLESSEVHSVYVTPAWLRTAEPSQVSELLISKERETGTRYMVLQPGFANLTPGLAAEIRQSRAGFPGSAETWPLLAERLSLEHHGGPVDVYSTDLMLQFGARRPVLPREVNWHLLSPESGPSPGNLPTSVVIGVDSAHRQDAGVIIAALNSLKAHRIPGLGWELADIGQLSTQQLNADWLILLSEDGLDENQWAQINTAGTVLMDGNDELSHDDSHPVRLPFYPFSRFSINGGGVEPMPGQTLSGTADGQPVFQARQYGPRRLLQFSSRFNPAWSSITQQAEFPELLLQLMLGSQGDQLSFSDVRVNPDRLHTDSSQQTLGLPLPRRSVQSLLASLLALLWIMERWISERKNHASR